MTPQQPLSAEHVAISCVGCGLRFAKPLQWLKVHNTVVCPACGHAIGVRRYKAQAAAAALFHKLTGFAGGSKGT